MLGLFQIQPLSIQPLSIQPRSIQPLSILSCWALLVPRFVMEILVVTSVLCRGHNSI